MKTTAVQCPNCGVSLNAAGANGANFCIYCGSRIVTENEREYVFHHIDEAQVKRVEMEREVRFRELELEKQRMQLEDMERKRAKLRKWMPYLVWIAVTGIFLLIAPPIGILILLVGTLVFFGVKPKQRKNREAKAAGKIRLKRELTQIANKKYQTMENEFQAAGFRDVRTVNMGDLVLGLKTKPGSVARVSINGNIEMKCGKWYDPNEVVVISYHGFPRR